MTVSLAVSTITASIASLSVSGMTIVDMSAIPPDVQGTRKQILFPEPENFITDFTITRDTFGMSIAKMTARYTLNYTYCHVPLGTGRTGLDAYDEMVGMWVLLVNAVMNSDTLSGAVEFEIPYIAEFGAVPDPSGQMYLGFRFPITVTEFQN